jgi:hypothetical protein
VQRAGASSNEEEACRQTAEHVEEIEEKLPEFCIEIKRTKF